MTVQGLHQPDHPLYGVGDKMGHISTDCDVSGTSRDGTTGRRRRFSFCVVCFMDCCSSETLSVKALLVLKTLETPASD